MHAALRVALRLALRWLRRRGYNLRHVCIVGAGELAREVVTRLRQAPWTGLVVHALYDDAPALAGSSIEGVPVCGPIAQLGGVYVLTILYLPMGLMGIPMRLRQRFSQDKNEDSKKLATKPS